MLSSPYLNPQQPTFERTYIKKSHKGTLKRWVIWGPGKAESLNLCFQAVSVSQRNVSPSLILLAFAQLFWGIWLFGVLAIRVEKSKGVRKDRELTAVRTHKGYNPKHLNPEALNPD